MTFPRLLYCLVLSTCTLTALSQQSPIGIFDGHSDIGKDVKPGSATYTPQTRQYEISGAGHNIWADQDEFQFVWKRMKGDFILYARAIFVGQGVELHRKIGWMIRRTLDGNSPHVNVAIHGDGLTALQFRRTTGAQTEEKRSAVTHADIIQLERKGNTYTMRVARFGEPFVTEDLSDIDLGDEVYVGLYVGSHNAGVLETGVFTDVRITVPYKGIADQNTNMTLGSNLELLDVATGSREIVHTAPNSIQGPNWSKDGSSIIFNGSDGLVYTFDLSSRQRTQLNTGEVKNNNNDHVLSFDGSTLGLSSFARDRGGSVIYTVPVIGGIPKLVTPNGPSYLHGWSPDGKFLVFCGDRNGEFDVYRVPVAGGPEARLTTAKGLDDGPEYSPDGRYIYFNSVRSGTMQIWRMQPDGSNQEQVTNDEYNNWFAHISPDGQWMVFLSFLPSEVAPSIHPPYKHVYLRLLPVPGSLSIPAASDNAAKSGTPKVIAYFYGGQGSINVPSWSPDSKRIAFISNSN